ncbi:hypothetical protein GCM10007301_11740 [Azorhizobium oxalatiphilum]|uniref:Uncharacterized protein n=1 Tax=Azorhizobium oxalatiphilum TaxID=980631 RepID=A0A917BR69_9HYPH|nr:hypothetical protein [Azorhizobium oxalatiphilum]GGF53914.1 hypothetical protein GCM10007301_11740 [Azorhizobium oxalatiphilum]
MLRTFIAAGLLVASSLPLAAQEKLVWAASTTDNGATLAFGAPESDHVMLTFTCNTGNTMVLVSSMIGSKGLKANDPARILLSAGKVKKEFPGKAVANEMTSAVDVEGGGKFDDVKAVLAAGKVLTVEVKGAKQPIALTGAPEAYAEFDKACRG